MQEKVGYYSSMESFGAVDGPGVRLVYFLQGCPLRCLYCHNPETQPVNKEKQISIAEILTKYENNKAFYEQGGITISGGEPLMQIDFVIALFKECKKRNIHTTVDTSVCTFSENPIILNKWKELVTVCDLFICDLKEFDSQKHKTLTGLGNENIIAGIKWLDANGAKMWIRTVLVPGFTDHHDNLVQIGQFLKTLKNCEKFELLPYHNMMIFKYKQLNLDFKLNGIEPPSKEYCKECLNIILSAKNSLSY
ncbi:pyruvate formate-lyase-activating protein [Spiroplasma chrysopicola]|uniref:Pyruvate formate-lyase-activating enzyme n=1 Tax=Spiroplasma chrysopicola DF-1 TaxID=1276227 RepID=R4U1Q2_9MOLU|nr:pyruvate formate-lyase-activating protein [Spiroplasma chrysopicola]AGM25247.1 pyruvate formate lyase activating enzyme [Spiroplasma chrysopicola DF-1]